ncbi:MAG: ABC transporter ATP-binding protein [Ruminococcaceae bacterium]|nr:ABC transporter ATP-binding protein [Oscillospiraceae bacterium]
MNQKPLVEFQNIYKIYTMGDSEVRALDGVSFSVFAGEFVAIIGQSGSGKSTCMNIIGCLDTPTEGTYLLNGNDVSQLTDDEQSEIRNETLGFIFQQYNLLPKLNILENVKLPLMYKGLKESEQTERAMEALKRVGIDDKCHHKPSQLSGGQQQRASIARALAGSPSVILADEPTGALDSKTSAEVINFLIQLNSLGNTIILITHDNSIAAKAKRVIRIHDGKIIYDGIPSEDSIIRSTVLSQREGAI